MEKKIPGYGIEDEDKTAVNHVPLVEGEIVDVVWNKAVYGYADGLEH